MQFSKSTLSLWLVLLVVFLDWTGLGLVYPMFSSMIYHSSSPLLGPETSQAAKGWYLGILLASMPIAQFFSGPILGSMSDQKGRKPIFVISLILGVFGYLFCTFAVLIKSVIVLILARFLVGISAGNTAVVSASIADLSTPETKAKNFGLFSMACGVGFTIGPVLGGKLSASGFAMPFVIACIAFLLNFLLILFWFKETHLKRKEVPVNLYVGIRNLKRAFHLKGLRVLFLVVLIFAIGWSFFYEFIPVTWIAEYKLNPGQIGLLYAYGAGFFAFSSGVLIRPIVARFKNDLVLLTGLALLGVVILSLLSKPSVYWTWVYMPFVNFFTALIYPTYTSMVSDWAGKDAQGETLGILQSVQAVGFALSPIGGGIVLTYSASATLVVGGIAMLLAAFILGALRVKESFEHKA